MLVIELGLGMPMGGYENCNPIRPERNSPTLTKGMYTLLLEYRVIDRYMPKRQKGGSLGADALS